MRWMIIALSMLCLTAYAEDKQFIPLPKDSSQEVQEVGKQHIFMMQKQETESASRTKEETAKPTFKQVRCQLSNRYRTCF